mmetsp:Transcript_17455/g.42826  ORF Transcript_17455/g.42826 Transcript_17455/m.42826 type:complete len:100 (-) Transcript_17455:1443-1742(-)
MSGTLPVHDRRRGKRKEREKGGKERERKEAKRTVDSILARLGVVYSYHSLWLDIVLAHAGFRVQIRARHQFETQIVDTQWVLKLNFLLYCWSQEVFLKV